MTAPSSAVTSSSTTPEKPSSDAESLPRQHESAAPQHDMAGSLTPNTTILTSSGSDDQNFSNVLKERMKQRKEKEDAALAHLRVQVKHLEAALTAETKRRVQAVKEVQEQAKEAVSQVTALWKESVEKEGTEMNRRLASLEERIADLEEHWKRDVTSIEKNIDSKAKQWESALGELQAQAETERKSRSRREEQIIQQINDVSEKYEKCWKEERHYRVSEVSKLTERVKTQEDVRDAQVKGLEGRIQKALDDLNNALEVEVNERQTRDTEIVTALNKYTEQVQTSLSFVSGI
jgi:chromosome segregation ATPase